MRNPVPVTPARGEKRIDCVRAGERSRNCPRNAQYYGRLARANMMSWRVDADADLRVSENATPTIATSDMRCSGVRAARAAGWRAFMFTRPSHVFV